MLTDEPISGFRHEKDCKIAKSMLAELIVYEFLGKEMAIKSADHFRKLREKGITIRKTADIIIASYCIEHNLPLLFSDKDFHPCVEHLGLRNAAYT